MPSGTDVGRWGILDPSLDLLLNVALPNMLRCWQAGHQPTAVRCGCWQRRHQLVGHFVCYLPCSGHKIVFQDVEEGVTALAVEPKLGIGQRAYLLHTGAPSRWQHSTVPRMLLARLAKSSAGSVEGMGCHCVGSRVQGMLRCGACASPLPCATCRGGDGAVGLRGPAASGCSTAHQAAVWRHHRHCHLPPPLLLRHG